MLRQASKLVGRGLAPAQTSLRLGGVRAISGGGPNTTEVYDMRAHLADTETSFLPAPAGTEYDFSPWPGAVVYKSAENDTNFSGLLTLALGVWLFDMIVYDVPNSGDFAQIDSPYDAIFRTGKSP